MIDTIRDLITELSKLDPDTKVRIMGLDDEQDCEPSEFWLTTHAPDGMVLLDYGAEKFAWRDEDGDNNDEEEGEDE